MPPPSQSWYIARTDALSARVLGVLVRSTACMRLVDLSDEGRQSNPLHSIVVVCTTTKQRGLETFLVLVSGGSEVSTKGLRSYLPVLVNVLCLYSI